MSMKMSGVIEIIVFAYKDETPNQPYCWSLTQSTSSTSHVDALKH